MLVGYSLSSLVIVLQGDGFKASTLLAFDVEGELFSFEFLML